MLSWPCTSAVFRRASSNPLGESTRDLGAGPPPHAEVIPSGDRTMYVDHERQRGLEAGRRWAQHASAHEIASIATASFDDLNGILPPNVSDHFVGGFREAVLHVWQGV